MDNKISIERCRQLLANEQNYTDKQVEEIREKAYLFADLVVSYFRAVTDKFVKSFQKVSAKASIAKP